MAWLDRVVIGRGILFILLVVGCAAKQKATGVADPAERITFSGSTNEVYKIENGNTDGIAYGTVGRPIVNDQCFSGDSSYTHRAGTTSAMTMLCNDDAGLWAFKLQIDVHLRQIICQGYAKPLWELFRRSSLQR